MGFSPHISDLEDETDGITCYLSPLWNEGREHFSCLLCLPYINRSMESVRLLMGTYKSTCRHIGLAYMGLWQKH